VINSSYQSCWFTVIKKDGKALWLIYSLEPLNAVTIKHSGVPPFIEQIAEQFASHMWGGILNLYVSYDKQLLDECLCDYTTFQSPFGALRLVTLLMGWTNSVPIFHDDVIYILQPKIPHITIPYINNVPCWGHTTCYINSAGMYETHPDNLGICQFIWEHFEGPNHVVQHMKYCGGTFSGHKVTLCAKEIMVVGHYPTLPHLQWHLFVSQWSPWSPLYWYGICFDGVIETRGDYVMHIEYLSLYFHNFLFPFIYK